MTEEEPRRYTMTAGRAAQTLSLSRMGFYDLVNRGELSFEERPHGQQLWKYFNPTEVADLCQKRAQAVSS